MVTVKSRPCIVLFNRAHYVSQLVVFAYYTNIYIYPAAIVYIQHTCMEYIGEWYSLVRIAIISLLIQLWLIFTIAG